MNFKNIVIPLAILCLIQCRNNNPSGSLNSGDAETQRLTAAIEEHPFEDSLYFLRAFHFYNQGSYDLSIQDLNYAIRLDSLRPAYYHLLADAYLDNKLSYEALNTLSRAAIVFPGRIPTLLKWCEFQHLLKQYESSLMTIRKIQSLDPLNAESFFMAGLNYRDMLDTGQAISNLQLATGLDDRHTDAWIVLGQMTQSRNPTLARRYFENAVRVDSTNTSALHSLAGFFQDQGDYVRALDLYHKIIELDPAYQDAFVHTGMIYFNMDSFARALNAFDILCRLEATNPDYSYYRGNAHEALGNISAARADYEQSLRLDPLHSKAKQALDKLK